MHDESRAGPFRTWLSTIPALLVLLFSVVQGTAEILQSRMLQVGEQTWPGYADVRFDPPPPDCNPDDYLPSAAAAEAPADDDEALLDDLFEDDKDAAGSADNVDDEALLDDLFEDEAAEEAPPGAEDEALLDDLFAEQEGGDGGDDALLDDLFADEEGGSAKKARGPSADQLKALEAARKRCQGEHDRYAELSAMLTPTLRAYRSTDTTLATITDLFGRYSQPALVLLLLICGATATGLRSHISLRPVRTKLDDRIAMSGQLLVLLVAAYSGWVHYAAIEAAGVDRPFPWLPLLWASGFGVIGVVALSQLLRPPDWLEEGGSLGSALLTGPLYVGMGLIAAVWFLLVEDHPAGLSIYLDKLTEHSQLYIQVGLYVWAGMLLKRTWLDTRFFDLLRPWKLAPELLAAVVVLAAALPTAYSGASGIFVIAAGAIIYQELRKAGARNQLALAATAMSGSMGVVLAPCLLVVIVASLNKQVTTTMLFGAGRWVFLLTSVLFVGALILTRRNPLTFAPPSEALPGTLKAVRGLVPYAVILVGVLGFYAVALDAWVNEHNAPKVLLVVLLAMLLWEGIGKSGEEATLPRLGLATTETTSHIGALLMLMALSIAFGGVVERAEVMSLVPSDLGSPVTTMAALTVMLVFIGMLMDPYGAVILVSATIAQVAYDNGIDPLHFWMVVLVAFELGYLTPPVALNHLLTRAVVGSDADVDDVPEGAGFWLRHERLLLPVTVMGIALLLVAFVPLTWS